MAGPCGHVKVSILVPSHPPRGGPVRFLPHEATMARGSERPLVSVIIPCYNQARFLGDAVESALSQRYPRTEVIVVDDGATDDTAAVAARYPAARYVWQPNQGLSGARNAGWRASKGECLVFL